MLNNDESAAKERGKGERSAKQAVPNVRRIIPGGRDSGEAEGLSGPLMTNGSMRASVVPLCR
jgi:hypothetical protein